MKYTQNLAIGAGWRVILFLEICDLRLALSAGICLNKTMPQKQHNHNNIKHLTTSLPSENELTNHEVASLRSQLGVHGNHSSSSMAADREYLKLQEIADEMRVSYSVVRRMVKQGQLPALSFSAGRRPIYRISRAAFEKFKEGSVIVPFKTSKTYHPSLPTGVELFV